MSKFARLGKLSKNLIKKLFKTMAKMIRHDFGGIHDALNKMIIAEVKAALELLPEKRIEGDSLCRVIVSPDCDYEPRDLCVEKVWIGDDGDLCFTGTEEHGNYIVDDDHDPWTENDDLLDITDFAYLIDQIAEQVEGDATYNLPGRSLLTCGYVAEQALCCGECLGQNEFLYN